VGLHLRARLEHVRYRRSLPGLYVPMDFNPMSSLWLLVAAFRVVRQLMDVSASKPLGQAEQGVGCYPAFANIRRIESMKSRS
jgi:hypothetical protein